MASPVVNSAGQYDIVTFIKGNGEVYKTWNSWTSGEMMQTQLGAGSVFYQCKGNAVGCNWEEFALTGNWIVRGLDTSPGDGAAYVLSNLDGTAGSPWSPRFMKPGDQFQRSADVDFYDLKTGNPRKSYTEKTWLKFVKFHASWMSPGGLTIANVIELEAYTDAAGKPGTIFERYFYGFNLGLVGWQGGPLKMGIAARPGNLPALQRMSLPWYSGLKITVPPVVLSVDDSRWKDYTAETAQDESTNVRLIPKKTGAFLASLEEGVKHAVQSIDRDDLTTAEQSYSEDGSLYWHPIKFTKDGKVILGWVRSDVIILTLKVEAPEPPPLNPLERQAVLTAVENIMVAQQTIHTNLFVLQSYLKEWGMTVEVATPPALSESIETTAALSTEH